MSPELTRRDAVVALGAAGIAGGLGGVTWEALTDDEPVSEPPPDERATIVAVAGALYPSEVTGIESFVETYVVGRVSDRPEYLDGLRAAAKRLDEYARSWHDRPYAGLDRETRQQVLDDYGLSDRDPDPDGDDIERVRYYLVNELLFALYSSPTGGSLVGLENPQGYAGGTTSYQRGPANSER